MCCERAIAFSKGIMKTALRLIAPACLFVTAAFAQNWTTVSAANITDLNQNKLAAGQLCFLATDQNDNPISFNVGGGGQVLKRAFCSAVAAGAVTAFTVPNPASTQPAGIYYRVTVKDTSSGLEVLRYTQVTFTGATFSFDNYAPANLGNFAPLTGNAVSGNLSVSGNTSITGSLTAGSFTPTVIASGQFTSNTANPAGAGIVRLASADTVDWRNNSNTANIALAKTSAAAGGIPADTLDVSGFGGLKLASPAISAEAAAPSGVSAADVLYADSTAHRWKMINNNGAADTVLGAATSDSLSNKTVDTANANAVKINGNTLSASAGSATVTVPAATDTLVARATTDTLSNKTLTGASNGNSVTLLNEQGPTGALTGNSTDQTVYTYTLPANTLGAGKCLRVRTWFNHTSGSASVTWKLIWGSSAYLSGSSTLSGTLFYEATICNNAGVTNAQHGSSINNVNNTVSIGGNGMTNTFSPLAAAVDTTQAQAISLSFNVANTDQAKGGEFMAELMQ
jgi:hypothetical protein